VGFVRLRGTAPVIVTETLDAVALAEAADEVRAMHGRVAKMQWASKKPDVRLDVATGGHCRYCPALRGCWAHTSITDATTPEEVDAFERKAALARAQLNARAAQTPVPLPDGRVYGPRVKERRKVASALALPVLRARHPALDVSALVEVSAAGLKRLGLDADAEMAALEAAGAVEVTQTEVVEAHKP
jgi:hypothetical protein